MEVHANHAFNPPRITTHEIYVNEKNIPDATYANDQTGIVARLRYDAEGLPMMSGSFHLVEVIAGAVRIVEIETGTVTVIAAPIQGGEGPPPPPPSL